MTAPSPRPAPLVLILGLVVAGPSLAGTPTPGPIPSSRPAPRDDAMRPFQDACIAGDVPRALEILDQQPELVQKLDGSQRTPLHHAARYGLTAACRRLIEQGCPLDAAAYNDFTALHLAAMNGRVEVVRVLIEAGADLERATSYGSSALREAAWRGDSEIIEALREAGARYDMVSAASLGDADRVRALLAAGSTEHQDPQVLHRACQLGRAEVVELLLKAGVDPDHHAFMTAPPLHFCTAHPEVVRLLLDAGSPLDVTIQMKGAPQEGLLHVAAYRGHAATVALLAERGLPVDGSSHRNHRSPLQLAAAEGRVEAVRTLLERGAPLEPLPSQGRSALMETAMRLQPRTQPERNAHLLECVQLLIAAGAEVDLITCLSLGDEARAARRIAADPEACTADTLRGVSPLQWCARWNRARSAERLLEAGAKPDACPSDDLRRPLHHAAFWGAAEVARVLVAHGAKLEARSKNGETPLLEAARCGQAEVVRTLLELGADVQARNEDGRLAVECVGRYGRPEATRAILEEAMDQLDGGRSASPRARRCAAAWAPSGSRCREAQSALSSSSGR